MVSRPTSFFCRSTNRRRRLAPASTPMQSATSSVKKSQDSRKPSTVFRVRCGRRRRSTGRSSRALHRAVGLGPHVGRATADDRVLAVRLVPDGSDLDALAAGLDQCIELRPSFQGETVAHAHRIARQLHEKTPRRPELYYMARAAPFCHGLIDGQHVFQGRIGLDMMAGGEDLAAAGTDFVHQPIDLRLRFPSAWSRCSQPCTSTPPCRAILPANSRFKS